MFASKSSVLKIKQKKKRERERYAVEVNTNINLADNKLLTKILNLKRVNTYD